MQGSTFLKGKRRQLFSLALSLNNGSPWEINALFWCHSVPQFSSKLEVEWSYARPSLLVIHQINAPEFQFIAYYVTVPNGDGAGHLFYAAYGVSCLCTDPKERLRREWPRRPDGYEPPALLLQGGGPGHRLVFTRVLTKYWSWTVKVDTRLPCLWTEHMWVSNSC